MGVNDKEQCNEGGAAGDNDDDDRRGDGSKLFGVVGRGRFNEDGRQRRVEECYVFRVLRYIFRVLTYQSHVTA